MLTIYSLGQGGADRVCAYLARGFADAGFRTEVLIFSNGGEAAADLVPLFGDRVRLTFLGRQGRSRTRDLIRHFPAFVRRINAARPDCVLSTGNSLNWISALGLRFSSQRDCRLVMKTTNPIVRPGETGLPAALRAAGYARAFAAADRVLALSDAETRELAAAFPQASSRFRTAINPYVTDAMLSAASVEREPGLVLGVGRMTPQKRFDLLLRAFADTAHPGARLVILGDGAERPGLEALVRELDIEDRVDMPGFVTEVAPWYARASLFVLSSRYEGLPAVVLEAMAANCPVISTDCFPAALELVGGAPGCALLYTPDPVRLAALIDAGLGDPHAVKLRAVAERYSIANAVRSHVAEVMELLGTGAQRAETG